MPQATKTTVKKQVTAEAAIDVKEHLSLQASALIKIAKAAKKTKLILLLSILFFAAKAQEINVKYGSTNVLHNSSLTSTSTGTDFGNVNINTGSASRTFTIENLGTATLNITSSVYRSGSGSSAFSITQPSSSISASSSSTFTVTFNPSSTGTSSVYIIIPNNDANESPYVFKVIGVGTDAEININGIPNGSSSSTISDLYFGQISIGSSYSRGYSIQNLGNETLYLNGSGAAPY